MAKVSTRNITAQNVEDILDAAGYGIGYWAVAARIEKNGSYTVTEAGDATDPKDFTKHNVTRAQIKSAVVALAEDGWPYIQAAFNNWSAEDGIDCGEIDSMNADGIVQQAIFGEVIYG